jgi:hypothetical protein
MRAGPAFLAIAAIVACARAPQRSTGPAVAPVVGNAEAAAAVDSGGMPQDLAVAVEARLTDLKRRGGDCAFYGAVLDSAYRSGRIAIRKYMWRVGPHLAAGEAKPSGEMTLARDIDSLNVGLRTIDEVTWSMEHEAVHIAFAIPSLPFEDRTRIDAIIRGCRS